MENEGLSYQISVDFLNAKKMSDVENEKVNVFLQHKAKRKQ